MHYLLSRESCTICRELLLTLKHHASERSEAIADRTTLAVFLKNKPSICF